MTIPWHALRYALAYSHAHPQASDRYLTIALSVAGSVPATGRPTSPGGWGEDEPESRRLHALVDLAKSGDAEAFGQLYDHYVQGIFRFVYYRVGSSTLAEDLTSETFVRALRSIQRFKWQGKDFGAWLTTIARNLIADHFKSSRSKLEITTDTIPEPRNSAPSTEEDVLSALSNEMLSVAINRLSKEQRECILMRFIQGLSIAQTAVALGRSEGAIKQLQLRAIRSLAKLVPQESR